MAKTPSPRCSNAVNYFLIVLIFVFVMLIYFYIVGFPTFFIKQERFAVHDESRLLPADKIVVMQGLGNPDLPVQATEYDAHDTSSPSVNGKEDGPKSKLVFAYNECKPECCASSGGYSCNGGCPCITKDQMNFIGTRGYNHKADKCSFDEIDY